MNIRRNKLGVQGMVLTSMRETIEEALSSISIKPYNIMLFGSRARGDYREDRDWDIFVVVDNKISL